MPRRNTAAWHRLNQYLEDRDTEIAMARSAAPEAISRDATVMVLSEHGYVTAVKGKNGFVCVVERAWMSPVDSPTFWDPKLRGPICFNPPAARSILPVTFERTKLGDCRQVELRDHRCQ